MKLKWTKTWPKKPGHYWFYGYRFRKEPDDKPEMNLVEVAFSGNNIPMYITKGHFLYKNEGAEGLWATAILPEPPNLKA